MHTISYHFSERQLAIKTQVRRIIMTALAPTSRTGVSIKMTDQWRLVFYKVTAVHLTAKSTLAIVAFITSRPAISMEQVNAAATHIMPSGKTITHALSAGHNIQRAAHRPSDFEYKMFSLRFIKNTLIVRR